MKRIVIHWTAGAHTPSNLDKQHYHKIIDGAGKVHDGKHPISANAGSVKGRKNYAAHTLNLNSDSIGVAVAAMAGAQERPFNAGAHPITPAQVKALAGLCATLAKQYGIPITPETILTHAEVQPVLNVRQRGKWDITWLPGMNAPGDPIAVGNKLRALIAMEAKPAPQKPASRSPHVNESAKSSTRPDGQVKKPAKPAFGIAGAVAIILAGLGLWLTEAWEKLMGLW